MRSTGSSGRPRKPCSNGARRRLSTARRVLLPRRPGRRARRGRRAGLRRPRRHRRARPGRTQGRGSPRRAARGRPAVAPARPRRPAARRSAARGVDTSRRPPRRRRYRAARLQRRTCTPARPRSALTTHGYPMRSAAAAHSAADVAYAHGATGNPPASSSSSDVGGSIQVVSARPPAWRLARRRASTSAVASRRLGWSATSSAIDASHGGPPSCEGDGGDRPLGCPERRQGAGVVVVGTDQRERQRRSGDVGDGERRGHLVETARLTDVDAHDDAGVDLAGTSDRFDDGRHTVGRDRRAEVDGIGGRRGRRHDPDDLGLELRRQHHDVQAAGVGGVGAEDERTAGVAHQGDPASSRGRLPFEQQADVDQLLQRAGAERHPCG